MVTALLLGALVLPAAAQELSVTPAADQSQQQTQMGPLVFQPVQNGMVGAPEIKFTQVGNQFGTLVGGYFGWLMDDTFLIGGAGYWQADGSFDRGISYGGIELGWYGKLGSVARFGARGLVGAGIGSGVQDFTYVPYSGSGSRHDQGWTPPSNGQPVTARYVYTTGFFVGEPQVSFIIRLTNWMSIDASVGYRFVGWANGMGDQFNGPTGGVTVRFGGSR
jgi:hypothetical protein